MELAPDTRQLAKYSPTSTPVLDVLRPVESRRRGRISSGEYFFLSSTVILTLIALPMLSRAAAAISPLPNLRAIEIAAAARLSIGKAINVKMTVLLKKKYSPELMRPRLRASTGRSTSSTGVEVGEYLASCRVSGASSIGEFSLVERYQRNHKCISVFSLLGCGR